MKYPGILFIAIIWILANCPEIKSQSSGEGSAVFLSLTNDDGLSQGTINALAQDETGFIWIGTNDGLNRYDGNEFLVFRNNYQDSTSISSNEVNTIVADQFGILWIGTGRGLNIFNPVENKFRLVRLKNLDESTSITRLEQESDSILWVGTRNKGLYRLSLKNGKVKEFQHVSNNEKTLPSNHVTYLFADSKNRLWLSFINGDFGFIDNQFRFINQDIFPKDTLNKSFNRVTGIAESKNGDLWLTTFGRSIYHLDENLKPVQANTYSPSGRLIPNILTCVNLISDSLLWFGTDMDGLGLYNIQQNTTTYFPPGRNESNILYRTVSVLFTDKNGNLWIGSNGKGINILSTQEKSFSLITPAISGGMNLRFASVRCILQENETSLWIGGYEGLQQFNPVTGKTTDFFDILPYTILPDLHDENLIWIGTEGTGLRRLNKSNGRYSQIPIWQYLKRLNGPPPDNYGGNIYILKNSGRDHLMAGTNIGLIILNKQTLNYKLYDHNPTDPESIIRGDINCILIDSKNRIWITSMQGELAQFHPDRETFTKVDLQKQGISGGISRITGIFEDHRGHLWLGTNYGAIELDEHATPITQLTVNDGLPNNTIYAVLADKTGMLWMSTNMGIVRYNPENGNMLHFNKTSGLPANEFNSGAYFNDEGKTIYFGSVDGVAYFNPEKITSARVPEKILVTEAEVIGDNNRMDYSIAYTNQIVLQPGEKFLKLAFSAIQFAKIGKTKFAFRLDEKTEKWVDLGEERYLTISLSEPGKHFLNIIADNGNGVWSEKPTRIEIILKPAFHQTNWFKGLVLIIIFAIIVSIYLIRINVIKQQKNKLEKLVARRTNQLRVINKELEEANSSKDRFLSVIAHDLKSPFNSLLGFSDILANDWKTLHDSEKIEFISLIKQTADDTYQLLINLLEWARLQKQQIEFSPDRFALANLADDAVKQLKTDAFLKNIRINNEIGKGITVFADRNMLHSVLRNLVSNSIKFTPKNGKIRLYAKNLAEEILVCVEDTGVGMTKQDAENLFKLQYRNSSKGTEGESGTGLGLVLCHEFIKKHDGNIRAESEPGKGSTFCFTLPKKTN